MSDVYYVHITVYDIPVELLNQFTSKVVKPYYPGGISQVIKDLMKKAVEKESERGLEKLLKIRKMYNQRCLESKMPLRKERSG